MDNDNLALISRLQHFSVGDGDGIRTTVFFSGCNLRCAWCHNPETIPPKPALLYDRLRCTGCGSCMRCCPIHAHEVDRHGHQVDRTACLSCGVCAAHCPSGALSMASRFYSMDEVMDFILEDRAFYDASGGGVTFSGGEPLLQHTFLSALASRCRAAGIRTLLDTALDVPPDVLSPFVSLIDRFYVDLKAADPLTYRHRTGGNMARIVDNMRSLHDSGAAAAVRIPIIPGYNDTPETLAPFADVLRDVGVHDVHLLPFHRLGAGKYTLLGQSYPYADTEPPAPAHMRALLSCFPPGLHVRIDG